MNELSHPLGFVSVRQTFAISLAQSNRSMRVREEAVRISRIRPFLAKENSAVSVKIMWSFMLTSMPARLSSSWVVPTMSSAEGRARPVGWLWARTTAEALYWIQSMAKRVTFIEASFRVPSMTMPL